MTDARPPASADPAARRAVPLVPAIALVAGVVVVLVGWRGFTRYADVTRAVAVEGEVVRAEVHPTSLDEPGPRGFLPYIEFTWEVSGVRANDNNAETQPPLPDEAAAERVVAAHAVGSSVTVYHDPDEPFRGSLVGASGAGVLAGTIGAIVAVFAVAGGLIALISSRDRSG